MSQVEIAIPPEGLARLEKVTKAYKVGLDDLKKEMFEVFNSEFMQKDNTFSNADEKLIYCTKVIQSRYITRGAIEVYDVVVTGIGRTFITKAGKSQGEIYVATQEENKKTKKSATVRRRIVFQGKETDKIKDIQIGCAYAPKLGKFKGGDFIADERTVFENPTTIDTPVIKLIQDLGVTRCNIAKAHENLARIEKTSTGSYMDRSDWRIIRGIIGNYNKGQTKEGQEWGVYTIFDDSLEDDFISPDNKTLTKQSFTVWVNPLWITLEKGNEVDFCGPLSFNPDAKEPREISMTAYLLVPIRTPMGAIKE